MTTTKRTYANDPDGTRLPIRIDATSNGEFLQPPLAPVSVEANRRALRQANANVRRTGRPRRDFLVSACGAATVRLVEALGTTRRLLVHGRCMPAYPENVAAMDELGQLFIDNVRRIGNKRLAVYEGLPFLQYEQNLKYVGEDRVLWGTDSIWYGSPQDQIMAFRDWLFAPPAVQA